MSQPLVLYDIWSNLPAETRAWGPNPWKIRLVLNYKRIAYRTVWVEFAEIADTMQAIGAAQTPSAIPGGPPRYTVPTIYDPNTGCTVTDSFKIAQYLDKQYPERPVIPTGTEESQAAFADAFLPNYGMPLYTYTTLPTLSILSEASRKRMESLLIGFDGGPPASERPAPSEADFDVLCDAYVRLANSLEAFKNDHGLANRGLLFVDCVVMAPLIWLQRVIPSERFESLLSRNDGQYQGMYDAVREYLDIDEGVQYVAGSVVQHSPHLAIITAS